MKKETLSEPKKRERERETLFLERRLLCRPGLRGRI